MAKNIQDVVLTEDLPTEFLLEKHLDFLENYIETQNKRQKGPSIHDPLDYLRMSGVYWCLTALGFASERSSRASQILSAIREDVISFVKSCYNEETGGFSPSPGHDCHILYTLSAVQLMTVIGALDRLDTEKISQYVCSLQNSDGSFCGDEWGEVDTRFSFCGLATLALLNKLDRADREKATNFILRCHNASDGGFGTRPSSESHAGQVYCCLGALSILQKLRALPDLEQCAWWLAERQLPSGGLNGRPEKAPDVCYSWWVLASLNILGRLEWIDATSLARFIFSAQDDETGGIADRPGDQPDPFHTMLGMAGLSLLSKNGAKGTEEGLQSGEEKNEEKNMANEAFGSAFGLLPVNPVFCLPEKVISELGVVDVQLL